MCKGGVAYDGYRWEESCIGSAFGHGDGCAHVYAACQSLEWGESAEGVASDVTKYAVVGIFCQHLVESRVYIPVSTSLAELWRTSSQILCGLEGWACFHAESLCHTVGCKLACAREVTSEPSLYWIVSAHHACHHLLHNRLSVFHDDERVILCSEGLDAVNRERVL